jgi:TM2 domain-containing membrane protein YozV
LILGGIVTLIGTGLGVMKAQSYVNKKAKEGIPKYQKIARVLNALGSAAGGEANIRKEGKGLNESLLTEEPFPSGPELALILGGIVTLIGTGLGVMKAQAYVDKKAKEGIPKYQKIARVLNALGSAAGRETNIRKEGQELAEAYSTIETLKNELNEINLLNAKLLYSNKIFKSKNLNESQKVKVLSSFDKAKNVGEVKMVFETLNEGIKVNKNTIKENLGRASKSTVTPTAKKPIVESNDAFLRMQKLAGLI